MQSPSLISAPETSPALSARTALVLGAGGIRGCAHPGVISVLREVGVPIDMVVGASVGSMFGLALAAGVPVERMIETVRSVRPVDIFRFYAGGLNPRGKDPIARLLYEAGEGKEFSDLEIPFAVAATDMETGLPVIINRGPVLDAVRASICLPFVARPVHIGGRYHLDGGLVDTAPVAAARELGAERVIAVCLGGNLRAPAWLRRRPWTRAALQRVGRGRRPGGTRLPDVLRFSARLCAACFDPPVPAQDADVLIWPDFGSLSPNSMFGAQFALQQGFEAARAAVLSYEL